MNVDQQVIHLVESLIDKINQKTATYETFNRSSFEQLREGYFPSSSSELSEIDAFLKDVQSSLAEYDALVAMPQITDLPEDTLAELQNSKDDLQRALDNARTLTSPSRRLPADVLAEIFGWYICFSRPCYGREDGYSLKVVGNYYRTPIGTFSDTTITSPTLKLTWICSFWRNLVSSQPSLWSSLFLELEQFEEHPIYLNLFHLYMERSNNAPLRLEVSTGQPLPVAKEIFDALLGCSARWHSVSLFIHHPSWVLNANENLSSEPQFRELENLKVMLTYRRSDTHNSSPLRIFSSCPKLLRYSGNRLSWDDLSVYDFSQLTDIHLQSFHGASMGHFFSRMPMLRRCYLEESRTAEGGTEEDLFDSLNSVEDVSHGSLVSDLAIPMDALLRSGTWKAVHLHQLISLEVLDGRFFRGTSESLAALDSILLRPQSSLRVLTLNELPTQNVIDLLVSQTSIASLTLRIDQPDVFNSSLSALLIALTASPLSLAKRSTDIAPNLCLLEIEILEGSFPSSITDGSHPELETPNARPVWAEEICRMVESRSVASSSFASGCALQRFALIAKNSYYRPGYLMVCARLAPLGVMPS